MAGHDRPVTPLWGQAGRQIPRDVSVVGFDDLLAEYLRPPLTTVQQDFAGLSEKPVTMLIGQIASPEANDSRRPSLAQIVASPLVVRASTGPPPTRQAVHLGVGIPRRRRAVNRRAPR